MGLKPASPPVAPAQAGAHINRPANPVNQKIPLANAVVGVKSREWQIGDKIENRWEIHKIFRGGMGVVYVVYDHRFRTVSAAKTFQDEFFNRDPRAAERFKQEALVWVNLDEHENVVHAEVVQDMAAKPTLFLEYVSGGDLGKWIGTKRLTENLPQVLRFAVQFCYGMEHALSRGVQAHRDIKPSNCLITENGTLKITDFGLAKAFDDLSIGIESAKENDGNRQGVDLGLTVTGQGMGTLPYMAPEQFDDVKRVDVRADIYSFGVMLFEMVTGRHPFAGRTPPEWRQLHKTRQPPELLHLDPSLKNVIEGCLAKDPARRFASFKVLREELTAIHKKLAGALIPEPANSQELNINRLINKGISVGSLGRREQALDLYEQALKINPCSENALVSKAAALGALGRHEEALACCERALEISPGYERAFGTKGIALIGLGRFEEAITCCDRALQITPGFELVHAAKGEALIGLGRFEEAVICCDRALQIHPGYEIAFVTKREALMSLGRLEEALACFDQILLFNVGHENALVSKGAVLINLGRLEEAILCCDRALQINPRFEDAWYNKGVALQKLRRNKEALACYDRLLQISPRHEKALANKVSAFTNLRRFQEAVTCCDQALQINPCLANLWAVKASLLRDLARHGEALACVDQSLQINPNIPLAILLKAAVLSELGRYREALGCFEQAQRLGQPAAAQGILLCQEKLKQA